jgi:transposase
MIGLGKGARVFASAKPTDMRKSFRALAAVVVADLADDPLSGAVFLFIAKNMKRAKVIWWDGTGFCLFQKQLAKNRFAAPWEHVHEGSVAMTASQLAIFFEGSPLAFMGALSLEEVAPQKLTTQIAPIR